MPFIASMPADSGPPAIYNRYPEIYRPWSEMSEAMMNGPSSLSRGERELIFAYAAGLAGCDFVYVAHAQVAYALGIAQGTVEALLNGEDTPSIEPRLMALLAFARKLTLSPTDVAEADVAAVYAAGNDDKAFDDMVGVVGRAMFMRCIAQAYGFVPMTVEQAAKKALKRVEHGYVNLYPAFRTGPQD